MQSHSSSIKIQFNDGSTVELEGKVSVMLEGCGLIVVTQEVESAKSIISSLTKEVVKGFPLSSVKHYELG